MKKAAIVLADGKSFIGNAFGATVDAENASIGEVVFNTSMSGYQEIVTDPSYAGQIMCFCYPHIGNVGCNDLDVESSAVHVEGVIVRDLSKRVSNFRSKESFENYLKRNNIMGLCDIDTRSLVRYIRDNGAQPGAMAVLEKEGDISLLQKKAAEYGSMEGKDFVREVSCEEAYSWNELPWDPVSNSYPEIAHGKMWSRPHVVAMDFGIKRNILRLLTGIGFRVTVVPASTSAEEIMELKPDGVFLSNGPGDPATLQDIVAEVKKLVGRVPVFGICLGHQILAQVFGGKTYKLKFGHRGANHPVKDLATGKVEISTQNHGFAVDPESLPERKYVSHLNLNDQTVAGLHSEEKQCFSVQYHPEASAGPHDSQYLFKRFYEFVVGYQQGSVSSS